MFLFNYTVSFSNNNKPFNDIDYDDINIEIISLAG